MLIRERIKPTTRYVDKLLLVINRKTKYYASNQSGHFHCSDLLMPHPFNLVKETKSVVKAKLTHLFQMKFFAKFVSFSYFPRIFFLAMSLKVFIDFLRVSPNQRGSNRFQKVGKRNSLPTCTLKRLAFFMHCEHFKCP